MKIGKVLGLGLIVLFSLPIASNAATQTAEASVAKAPAEGYLVGTNSGPQSTVSGTRARVSNPYRARRRVRVVQPVQPLNIVGKSSATDLSKAE